MGEICMTKNFKDIDSIIFDLDGTLWDSRKEVADSWSEIIKQYDYKNVKDIISSKLMPSATTAILECYLDVDAANLNSRISLLYATYLTIIYSKEPKECAYFHLVSQIYNRLINEINLNLGIDYRELWLLENTICILCNSYISWTESKI